MFTIAWHNVRSRPGRFVGSLVALTLGVALIAATVIILVACHVHHRFAVGDRPVADAPHGADRGALTCDVQTHRRRRPRPRTRCWSCLPMRSHVGGTAVGQPGQTRRSLTGQTGQLVLGLLPAPALGPLLLIDDVALAVESWHSDFSPDVSGPRQLHAPCSRVVLRWTRSIGRARSAGRVVVSSSDPVNDAGGRSRRGSDGRIVV